MNNIPIAPIAVLVISAILYAASATGEGGGYEFPTLIALVMCVFAAGMLAHALGPGRRAKDERPGTVPWGAIVPGLALFVAYLFVMQWVGFFVTSFLVFLAIAVLYAPGKQTLAGVGRTAGVSAVFTVALYAVFVLLLQVQFPQGLLF